jgi:2-dehydro-3-deoxygluconokinase
VRYYRRGSAASAMGPAALDAPAVRTAGVLHLTGITPALSPSCRELVEAGLARPGLVSFDVNWRPSLWRDDPGALLRRLADQADVVFVGLDEAAALWGSADAAAVRESLPSPAVVVVKDGEVEATALTAGGAVRVPALTVDVVDVVGAGDAFAAGFLAGLLGGLDAVGQLRLGHLTAAAALRAPADRGPLLDRPELDRLLHADDDTWSAAVIGGAAARGGG